ERVLTVAWEKQSESNATWALTVGGPHSTSLVVGAGGYFAPHIRAYMRRSGAPDHIGTLVAVKDRQNALKNPYAHLKIPGIYRQAGISDPRQEIDVAEVYVPFSWYEPMWLENLGFCGEGEGWKLTESGATALDGDIPWNASGGVLSSNPIGASGMIRFAEAAL